MCNEQTPFRRPEETHLCHTSHIIVENQDENASYCICCFSVKGKPLQPGASLVSVNHELAHLCKGESSVKYIQLHYHQKMIAADGNRAGWLDLLCCPFLKVWILTEKLDAVKLLVLIVPVGCLIYDVVHWNLKENVSPIRVNERKVHCSDRLWLLFYWANLQIRAVTCKKALMWNPVFKEPLFFT